MRTQISKEEVIELLDNAEISYEGDYMEVRTLEIDGTKYRKVQQFAGRGKTRRELPPKYQVFNKESNRWENL